MPLPPLYSSIGWTDVSKSMIVKHQSRDYFARSKDDPKAHIFPLYLTGNEEFDYVEVVNGATFVRLFNIGSGTYNWVLVEYAYDSEDNRFRAINVSKNVLWTEGYPLSNLRLVGRDLVFSTKKRKSKQTEFRVELRR
jgi:hypothetical protein